MEMTCLVLAINDTPYFAVPTQPLMLELPVAPSSPRMKMPRSIGRSYTDSELTAAAAMLDRLRKRLEVVEHAADILPDPIDVVVERLIDRLE